MNVLLRKGRNMHTYINKSISKTLRLFEFIDYDITFTITSFNIGIRQKYHLDYDINFKDAS